MTNENQETPPPQEYDDERLGDLLKPGAGYIPPDYQPDIATPDSGDYQVEGAEPAPDDDFFTPLADPVPAPIDTGSNSQSQDRAILLDVSQFQPESFPFEQLKAEGVTGVYVRLTFGDRADRLCNQHLSRAKQAGLLVGGYHFLDGRKEIQPQFEAFQQGLSSWQLDLPPVVDVEEVASLNIPLPQAWQVQAFVERLKVIRPQIMIYTSKRYYDLVGDDNFGCDLWVAHWEGNSPLENPLIPNAWRHSGWTLWQYTDQSRFAGYTGGLDTNRFNGNNDDLRTFAKKL
ncbi:MAG: lysozyme [Cellvibrionaceae bacterium]|jgi:lysozyme